MPSFKMPAEQAVEENHVLTQVPQPSETAQLSERDQTETGTQNDELEEATNEQRERLWTLHKSKKEASLTSFR